MVEVMKIMAISFKSSHSRTVTPSAPNPAADLTEAKDIKKRWQEYTELCKKDLHDPDNHDGVITHLEPDNLERKVK